MANKVLGPLVVIVLVAVTWEAVRFSWSLPVIILPPLKDVVGALATSQLYYHCAVTLAEAALGFALGNATAILVSIAFVRWRVLENSVMPLAIALKTTPVVAVAPILILWLGSGLAAKVAAAAAVCFFPTLINVTRGLRIVDSKDHRDYVDLFRVWGADWTSTLWHLRVPFALPLMFSALKISSSLALVGAIVAEFIAADRGLGYLIVVFSRRLDAAEMFAAVLVAAGMGVVWFYIIASVERRLTRRFGSLASEGQVL